MPRRGSNRPFGANGLKQRDLAGTYATTVGKVRDEWKGAYLSLVKAPHDQYIRTVLINTPSEKQELDSRGLEHYGQNRPARSRPKDVALSTYPRAFACANTSCLGAGVRRGPRHSRHDVVGTLQNRPTCRKTCATDLSHLTNRYSDWKRLRFGREYAAIRRDWLASPFPHRDQITRRPIIFCRRDSAATASRIIVCRLAVLCVP